jgi:hypothetical protein
VTPIARAVAMRWIRVVSRGGAVISTDEEMLRMIA